MRTYSGYQKNDNGGNKVKQRSTRMVFAAIALVFAVYMVVVMVGIGQDADTAQPGPGELGVRIVLHGSVPAVYLVLPPLPSGLSPHERMEAAHEIASALAEAYAAEMIQVTADGATLAVVWR